MVQVIECSATPGDLTTRNSILASGLFPFPARVTISYRKTDNDGRGALDDSMILIFNADSIEDFVGRTWTHTEEKPPVATLPHSLSLAENYSTFL